MAAPKQIPLRARDGSVRAYALVDPEDFDRINAHRWSLCGSRPGLPVYAARTVWVANPGGRGSGGRYTRTSMHRAVLGLTDGNIHTDHINGDPLDNRRSNLRAVTREQNAQNLPARKNTTSKYRGVHFDTRSQRWLAHASVAGKKHRVGSFRDEDEAGRRVSEFRRIHAPFSNESRTMAA